MKYPLPIVTSDSQTGTSVDGIHIWDKISTESAFRVCRNDSPPRPNRIRKREINRMKVSNALSLNLVRLG
jgi:hypothetical protein